MFANHFCAVCYLVHSFPGTEGHSALSTYIFFLDNLPQICQIATCSRPLNKSYSDLLIYMSYLYTCYW